MRNPDVYLTIEIKRWNTETKSKDGKWIPARPLPLNITLVENIKNYLACVYRQI